MKTAPSTIEGVRLIAPGSEEFERELEPLLGRAPRELIAPALPYSVIFANDSGRAIALLGIRFDMTGPYAKPYSVIHYADTLRNPEKSDLRPGVRRFVCAEPSFTALLLRRDGDLSSRGRHNLDNLRRTSDISASIDCVAFDDGQFEGPDTQRAFERLAKQRQMEASFLIEVVSMSAVDADRYLRAAIEDAGDRARRMLARKLLDGLELDGPEGMMRQASHHRLKTAVWRAATLPPTAAAGCGTHQ
ncbi:MAG TPA: hypothetical protein VFT60_08815 [Bryobacteraceae bacterium]|nr:hypothetical protein [Bryobacteraceae bacterium]